MISDINDQIKSKKRQIKSALRLLSQENFRLVIYWILKTRGYYIEYTTANDKAEISHIAYKDDLGTDELKVAVHSDHNSSWDFEKEKFAEKNLIQVYGLFNHHNEVGLIFSSRKITDSAYEKARILEQKITIIDLDRMAELWCFSQNQSRNISVTGMNIDIAFELKELLSQHG